MNQVKENNTVKVHYTGKLSNGQVFDSSEGKEPLEFTLGKGQIIPGFEKGLIDMKLNEKKLVDQLDEIDLGEVFVEDCSDNDNEDHKVIEIDEKSINFWLTDGVLDEIQWSPLFINDDTIKWPK